MSRYIVIGAGAVGAILAARLHEARLPYVLVGRGENIRVIRDEGLRYIVHGEERRIPVSAVDDPAAVALTPDDVLVFAVKTQDLESAARVWAWQPVGQGTASWELPAVSVQNGLDADRILLRRFRRVVGGSLLTPAQHLEPGVVRSGALGPSGVLTLGPVGRPGVDLETVERIAEELRGVGYLVEVRADLDRWKAAKILHSVKNGVEVLSGSDDDRHALADLLAAEAREVLTAVGYDAATPDERTIDLSGFRQDPSSGIAPGQQSTWQSVSRGVPNEADFLNGEIVLLGRLSGVATPANAALQAHLGRAWLLGLGPGELQVADVLDTLSSRSRA